MYLKKSVSLWPMALDVCKVLGIALRIMCVCACVRACVLTCMCLCFMTLGDGLCFYLYFYVWCMCHLGIVSVPFEYDTTGEQFV